MTQAERQAYKAGMTAFETGKTIHDNPWVTLANCDDRSKCPLASAWDAGYDYALDGSL